MVIESFTPLMTSTERWAPRSRSGERTGVSIGDAAVDEGRVGVRRRAASAVFVVAIGRVRPAAARPLHRPTYPLLAQPPRRPFAELSPLAPLLPALIATAAPNAPLSGTCCRS